ncbi:hypothetical protein SARC_03744 [Sphaeroforma arctica JP610]|uniref:Nucleolar complex-associated protein 3-like protein n=1 Tax=Sphaeroforma arctica JP610 TaxID=667725 RepID=A0A0L0G538_9EUKA|nr:hypothetical protein SARC_03744 [Sphaeroforma arctica JP610]KNC84034.1 hypothetical protein SARC_03744 [Sphaeroforma arctica JP610]|eukprot:XP_014157936.1 hypothetical protein SARC_03744 [Sphaeroforma arctica JP610]
MGVRKSSAGAGKTKDGPGGGGLKKKGTAAKKKPSQKGKKGGAAPGDQLDPYIQPTSNKSKKTAAEKKHAAMYVSIPAVTADGSEDDSEQDDNMEGLEELDIKQTRFLANLDAKALSVRRDVLNEKERESKEKQDVDAIHAKVRAAQMAMDVHNDSVGVRDNAASKKRKAAAASLDASNTWQHEKKARAFVSSSAQERNSGHLPIKMTNGKIRTNERLVIARAQMSDEESEDSASEDESKDKNSTKKGAKGSKEAKKAARKAGKVNGFTKSKVERVSESSADNASDSASGSDAQIIVASDDDDNEAYGLAKDTAADSDFDTDISDNEAKPNKPNTESDSSDSEDDINPAIALLKTRETFATLRQQIAKLSQLLLEDCEGNMTAFAQLLEIASDATNDSRARKLALVSLMAVYKDVLPGYRIRLPTEAEQKQKVSKEVAVLRAFEASLLGSYQKYLQFMQKMLETYNRRVVKIRKVSKDEKKGDLAALVEGLKHVEVLVEVCVKCMGEMLLAKPSFNFGNNIIHSILPFAQEGPRRVPSIVCSYVRQLYSGDSDMLSVLEVTRGIAQMIKTHNYQARRELLECFASLTLKTDLYDKTINPITNARSAPIATDYHGNEVHKSKKQRKKNKLDKELERDLEKASALENQKELKLRYNEILKMVFLTYFRILKHGGASPLLSATLKGLARFSHLINVDFFTDLLKAFKRTLLLPNLPYSDAINCVATSFQICSGQGDVLLLDLRDFFSHLYVLLLSLPSNTEHMRTVLECFDYVRGQSHMLTLERVASFVKRLVTVALEVPSGGAIALLAYAYQLLLKSPRAQVMLDNDIVGNGRFIPFATDPENANATSCPLWELIPLSNHAHPIVAIYAQELRKLGGGEMGSGRENTHHAMPPALRTSPMNLYRIYDTSQGGFNPPIQQPKAHPITKNSKEGEDVYMKPSGVPSVFEC